MKTALDMTIDEGCPKVNVGIVGAMKESNRVVKTTKRGIRALELEVQD